jgi:hypothetical protein
MCLRYRRANTLYRRTKGLVFEEESSEGNIEKSETKVVQILTDQLTVCFPFAGAIAT